MVGEQGAGGRLRCLIRSPTTQRCSYATLLIAIFAALQISWWLNVALAAARSIELHQLTYMVAFDTILSLRNLFMKCIAFE
eukprot:scaffold33233_cov66-Skeletonema_marinoi.AAC.1